MDSILSFLGQVQTYGSAAATTTTSLANSINSVRTNFESVQGQTIQMPIDKAAGDSKTIQDTEPYVDPGQVPFYKQKAFLIGAGVLLVAGAAFLAFRRR